ncbi:DUF2797 domain-containing protein [Arthrobacter sp.]|jgi:hypothetical protein|uniref:DUF2797 domain-containing protein n=1 Tax=Arthrobacter sp. TaxID=1667 RepID=UPI00259019D1|nr:DUF2797 domain-containing protein [Arthrobacter sp.]
MARFRVEHGAGVPARYCLGFSVVLGPNDAEHHSCPTLQAAERGYQCGSCFARDDFRFMHDSHRRGIGPPGLKAYLAQPHWLYIATFADGTVKVGTASQRSKWSRLAEQGAIVARYVAHARDGSVVRMLEDAVSAELGLTQCVRGAATFASLLQPKPEAELDAVNATASGGTTPGRRFWPTSPGRRDTRSSSATTRLRSPRCRSPSSNPAFEPVSGG